MVVLLAVRVGAEVVGGEVHAAALAVVLGHLEQVRERLACDRADELHHIDARGDLAALPAAHGLARDVELGGEAFLREIVRAADGDELVCECHDDSFLRICSLVKVWPRVRGLPSNRWLRKAESPAGMNCLPFLGHEKCMS